MHSAWGATVTVQVFCAHLCGWNLNFIDLYISPASKFLRCYRVPRQCFRVHPSIHIFASKAPQWRFILLQFVLTDLSCLTRTLNTLKGFKRLIALGLRGKNSATHCQCETNRHWTYHLLQQYTFYKCVVQIFGINTKTIPAKNTI